MIIKMQSDLLIRLVKAYYNNNNELIERTINDIYNIEKKSKHQKLANKLEEIISKKQKIREGYISAKTEKLWDLFVELPKNPRNNLSLASLIPFEQLRHNMVLEEDIEKRFLKIEKEFSARRRLATYNLKPKKKILLYGAPGCWKTMWAERIAWNIWLPLVKVNFDSLISSFMWETSSNLRSIFDISKKFNCVLLLDECDIIAKSRLLKHDVWEMSRIVNMLLLLLDEYTSDGLLIATTNLEESLDKAIYRRFDDIIQISIPKEKEVYQLINNTLSIYKYKWFEIEDLLKKMKWLSAADVVSISENAIKSAILSWRKYVEIQDFNYAIDEHYKVQS